MLQGLRFHVPIRSLLEGLFPRACSLCGEVGTANDPCLDCERSLSPLLIDAACPRCATPTCAGSVLVPASSGHASSICSACIDRPPPFDRVVAPWSFAPPLSSLVHRMKYSRDLAAAAALGRLLAKELSVRAGPIVPDAVIGLPLSRRRLLSRGFNHAEELAAIVRRELELPLPKKWRIVRRHSPPQARTGSPAERFANVEGAFIVHQWPPAVRRIAIVDDVLTTGATASALSEALRDRGVEWIEVWCCARTPLS